MAIHGSDTILTNARIHSLDPATPHPTAIAIRDGRILAIGSEKEVRGLSVSGARAFDLHGSTILPGLADSHIHLEQYARSLNEVDCETPGVEGCLARLRDKADRTPPGEWILGHGWSEEAWGRYGTLEELDAATPHHPVYLTAKSLHSAWANSLALEQAKLSSSTPDPPGGVLQRSGSGSLTGVLFENAMNLVAGVMPPPSPEGLVRHLREAQANLHAYGVTCVHDFDGARCFDSLRLLRDRDELRLRVVKYLPVDLLGHARETGLRYGLGDTWLRIGGIKLFADGALGTRTAAMLLPYDGEPGNRGMRLLDSASLIDHGMAAMKGGFPLAVHAIGDRANRTVLDAFRALREYEERREGPRLRHRIEHVQLLDADDLDRPAALGVIASMQPFHATSDMAMANRWWGKRAVLAYAWNGLLQSGATLAFGSDAPVEKPNPFWGLHAAVTRRRQDGTPSPEGWIPEQRISLSAALEACTLGPAYAAGLERLVGRLRPGYLADLVVTEEDPFEVDPQGLFRLRPTATMVGGEWVYGEAS